MGLSSLDAVVLKFTVGPRASQLHQSLCVLCGEALGQRDSVTV